MSVLMFGSPLHEDLQLHLQNCRGWHRAGHTLTVQQIPVPTCCRAQRRHGCSVPWQHAHAGRPGRLV